METVEVIPPSLVAPAMSLRWLTLMAAIHALAFEGRKVLAANDNSVEGTFSPPICAIHLRNRKKPRPRSLLDKNYAGNSTLKVYCSIAARSVRYPYNLLSWRVTFFC